MADYLQTNTARIRVTQTGPRGTHKMVFRVDPASTIALARDEAHAICTLMLPFMLSATAWPSAESAAEGSDVFLPIDWTTIIHTDGIEAANNSHEYGAYCNFFGRSAGGSRCAWYLFNIINAVKTANNRLTAAEFPSLTALLDAFNGSAGIISGIDQNPFIMKGYANTGINGRVAKKARALA
jgi:hypothetical protein